MFSLLSKITHLDEIVKSSKIAFLMVAKLPGFLVGNGNAFGDRYGFGKVNHPHTCLIFVKNDQDTASNHLLREERSMAVTAC